MESRYIHIRLRDPKGLRSMRTVERGPIKQVMGKDKHGDWVEQNILIKKQQIKKSGSKIVITNKKTREAVKQKISLSSVVHDPSGGEMDYKIKKK